MKNLKIIVGLIAIIAAITFASCGDPEETGETFLVQFDSDGGSSVDSQNVVSGKTADKPANPTKSGAAAVPSAEGLYALPITINFAGWQLDGEDFDFSKPITAHITLKAKWTTSASPITLTGSNDIVTNAINYLKTANAGGYILALGSDVTSGSQSIEKIGIQLTIVGIGSERTITKSGATYLFAFGKAGTGSTVTGTTQDTTMALTLGNNITLKGTAPTVGSQPLVWIRNGTKFTMLSGSKITLNSSSSDSGISSCALHIDWSDFTMEAGSITGNTSTLTSKAKVVGGVYADDKSNVTLKGGSISGNVGMTKDFYLVGSSTLSISGAASIGELALSIASSGTSAFVTVSSDFTGSVSVLNLIGGASDWVNKDILKPVSGSLTAAIIDKFTLGSFINGDTAAKTSISATHKIDTDGKLKTK